MFSFGRVRSRGADRRAFTDSLLGGSAEKNRRDPRSRSTDRRKGGVGGEGGKKARRDR